VPPKPRTDGQQLRDMLVSEGIPVFNAEIPRLAAFEKAAAEGVPVYGVKEDRNAPPVPGTPTRRRERRSSMPKSRKFAALAALHHQQAEVEARGCKSRSPATRSRRSERPTFSTGIEPPLGPTLEQEQNRGILL
jgi:hypothetical protein